MQVVIITVIPRPRGPEPRVARELLLSLCCARARPSSDRGAQDGEGDREKFFRVSPRRPRARTTARATTTLTTTTSRNNDKSNNSNHSASNNHNSDRATEGPRASSRPRSTFVAALCSSAALERPRGPGRRGRQGEIFQSKTTSPRCSDDGDGDDDVDHNDE